ncbi:tetratricopeptide repeat protein, partial [Mesobacillus boroniphilus]|uniref:tetratricopeptide repeat protein n=1 Tax=Mesobacillus boroniphilus TaxID=308892 RepID=UPI0005545924
MDLHSVLERVITVAQEEFINNSTTDPKLMNYILLRQPPNVTKNDLDVSIKELLKVLSQSFKEKEEDTEKPKNFSFRYNKCIQLFESDRDIECLQEIQIILKDMELSQKEKQALNILEICVHYKRFEYEKAFIMIKEINEEIEEEVLFYYIGIKGAVLSEMGVQKKSATYIRQGIHCFEQQLDLVTEENSNFVHSILYNLGTSHLNVKENSNDIELAIEYLEEAAKLNPSDAQVYKNLGSAIGYKGNYEKEMELYDKALALNPNLFEALCAKAWGLLNYEHQIDESIALYKKALTHKDRMFHFPTIYYWLAINYLHKDSLDIVLQTIDKGLEIEPDNIHLLGLKIDTISNSFNENPSKYLQKLHQLIEISGSGLDTEMKIQIINTLISANDLRKAQEIVDSLLSQGECNRLTDVLIGFVYFLYDNNKESLKDENVIKYLNQINSNYIQNRDLVEPYNFLMSQYYLLNEQHDESIEALKQILSDGMMSIPIHNVYALIGDGYAQKEDYENS